MQLASNVTFQTPLWSFGLDPHDELIVVSVVVNSYPESQVTVITTHAVLASTVAVVDCVIVGKTHATAATKGKNNGVHYLYLCNLKDCIIDLSAG